jgi:hypothetical protein
MMSGRQSSAGDGITIFALVIFAIGLVLGAWLFADLLGINPTGISLTEP